MSQFGRRKSDNQAYPKSRKSKLKRTGSTTGSGVPIKPKTLSEMNQDWCCKYCEHFTTIKQNYCAGCGRKKNPIIFKESIGDMLRGTSK